MGARHNDICGKQVTVFFQISPLKITGVDGQNPSACGLPMTMPFIYDRTIVCQVCCTTCSNPVRMVIPSQSVAAATDLIKETIGASSKISVIFSS